MSKLTVRKTVELNSIDVEWFTHQYGGAGLSWVLGALLEEFRKAHVLDPKDYASIAAKSLMKGIRDERV